MYIGEIIKEYREKNNLSQRAFAARTTLSPSYINTLEKIFNPKNGKAYSVTTDTAVELANAMFMTIDDLLKSLEPNQEFIVNTNKNGNTKRALPLLGMVKAGYNYLASENIISYVSVDRPINDIENCYALQVVGDSMEPVLYEDDIIVVHKQDDVESGQVGIVLIDDNEATVKKILKYNDYVELISFNSYYPPKKLTKDFKIIGKVIEGRITKIFE